MSCLQDFKHLLQMVRTISHNMWIYVYVDDDDDDDDWDVSSPLLWEPPPAPVYTYTC